MSVFKDGKEIKLREDFTAQAVVVFVDDKEVFRSNEYARCTEYLDKNYQCSDDEKWAVYHDYKRDFNSKLSL